MLQHPLGTSCLWRSGYCPPPPNLKVWIRYLVYQACSTESLQLGKILIQTKKEEKLKDCKFADKYSSRLAPLDLWERNILFFFSESFPLEELYYFMFQANFSRFFLENGQSFLSFWWLVSIMINNWGKNKAKQNNFPSWLRSCSLCTKSINICLDQI